MYPTFGDHHIPLLGAGTVNLTITILPGRCYTPMEMEIIMPYVSHVRFHAYAVSKTRGRSCSLQGLPEGKLFWHLLPTPHHSKLIPNGKFLSHTVH